MESPTVDEYQDACDSYHTMSHEYSCKVILLLESCIIVLLNAHDKSVYPKPRDPKHKESLFLIILTSRIQVKKHYFSII